MVDSAMSKIIKGKEPKRKIKIKDMPGSNEVMSLLTKKQKTLPDALKKKIIESKKSGAGYSGD